MNTRLDMILNSIEALTTVDWNLLLEDTEFRKLFFQLIGDKNKNSGWKKYAEEFGLYDWEV